MKTRHNDKMAGYNQIICYVFLLCLLMTSSCSRDEKEAGIPSGSAASQEKKDTKIEDSIKAPVIEKQPDSIKVISGEPALFSILIAKSGSAKCQWQVYDLERTEWTDIKGANKDRYIIMRTKQEMSGRKYRCIVSNPAGQAISNEAVLMVIKDKS